MVVFAGLVVPGNDPITMLALAIALILLYELSVQVTRIHDRRAGKKAGLAELADNEASALPDLLTDTDLAADRDLEAQPVAAATAIPEPEPMTPRRNDMRASDLGDAT
jgi:sec-independent protein translocase protein TatC